jgi:precorrin-2 dehydrogenase/sirohydrochlorin ferrochelatase
MTAGSHEYYPIWLDIMGKSCLVVGGGLIAERKIASLLEAKADVTVISLTITPAITEWMEQGLVKVIRKAYDSDNGRNRFLVIAATDVAAVNEQVCNDASSRGQLINRVDAPKQSSFIVPALIRRGKLAIAVSTSGASPSLAAEICEKLADEYGAEYELYVDFLGELRFLLQKRIQDPKERGRILKEALQLNILASIRAGTFQKEVWFAEIENLIT